MSKRVFVLIAAAFVALSFVCTASAQEPEQVTAWTDRAEYAPGETGILYAVFYNDAVDAVEIERIIVIFEGWRAYSNGDWKGNRTLPVNKAVVSGGAYATETTFTVPTDGRAVSTSVDVIIQTEDGDVFISLLRKPFIRVSETPRHFTQIVTLFTILVVLMIVCTIILAATIFLSSRRPQLEQQKRESAQKKKE